MTLVVNKPKLFLTGGRGMVGRNLLEHVGAKNWEIFSPSRKELDLADYQAVVRCIRSIKPDVIVHAAGRVGGIQANISDPVDFLVANLDLGRNIVLAARANGVQRLLNLGSSCMYPHNAPNPLRETFILTGPLEPTNEGYALAKVVTMRLCQYVRREDSSFLYKTLIPCNLYGRYDKFDPDRSHLIPAIIHKIHRAKIEGHSKVDIWGDGTARREFLYAGDFADAVWQCLSDFDALPDLMNIGLGFDYSINDYYALVAEALGWNGHFYNDASKPIGMKQKLVDTSLQQEFGWQPRTSLKDGLAKTYSYYLEGYTK